MPPARRSAAASLCYSNIQANAMSPPRRRRHRPLGERGSKRHCRVQVHRGLPTILSPPVPLAENQGFCCLPGPPRSLGTGPCMHPSRTLKPLLPESSLFSSLPLILGKRQLISTCPVSFKISPPLNKSTACNQGQCVKQKHSCPCLVVSDVILCEYKVLQT